MLIKCGLILNLQIPENVGSVSCWYCKVSLEEGEISIQLKREEVFSIAESKGKFSHLSIRAGKMKLSRNTGANHHDLQLRLNRLASVT